MSRIGVIYCDVQGESGHWFRSCFGPTAWPEFDPNPTDDGELVGVEACAECTGDRTCTIAEKANRLKAAGAEVIHLRYSRISACPWTDRLVRRIGKLSGLGVVVVSRP